jgi:hypothetical protein
LKWKKCHWGITGEDGMDFLGHKVSGKGLAPNEGNNDNVKRFRSVGMILQ